MIELGQLLPRFRGMAGLTSAWPSRRLRLLHALIELPIVRIGMATRATQTGPVINRCGRLEIGGLFVTIGARHRYVLASQQEAGLFVAGQRKRGRSVGLNGMAAFAGVEIWRRSELAGVLIFMTVGAVLKLHLEQSVDATRDVAFFASDFGMRALQWIRGRHMICDRESGRLPAIHRVTSRALASIGTLGELSLVGIGLVAVGALRECNRLFEIAAAVALDAPNRSVFPEQWKVGFGMIEFLVETCSKLLPAAGVMARLAGLRKRAVVRIAMAIRTLPKRNSCVTRLVVGTRCVALLACHLHVHAGQWIARFRVIELLRADRLPVSRVMALGAVVSKTSLVRILVTTHARPREPKERAVQIFDLDAGALGGWNLLRGMALFACQAGMLAFQCESGLRVIEAFRVPLNQRKILPVVIGVAGGASLARSGLNVVGGVQSLMRRHARCDFCVAL